MKQIYTSQVYTWSAVLLIVLASTTGDVLLAKAMKQVGDLHVLWRQHGFWSVVARILRTPLFFVGVLAMAFAFYSLLFGLSWGDVSLIAPASASLTFVANAIAAKFFLKERVDHRRWTAALFVAAGVLLLAF
jgi:drug/metabolite transporter (DMT)-like permease